MGRWKKFIIGSVLALSSLALVGLVRNPDIYFLIKKNFTIFSEVYREVSLHYVDEVDPEQLMRKGINAMLSSLDPYTVLIDEADNQDIEIMTKGSYGGVGLDVGYRNNEIVVVAPIEGYSAYSKGIRAGDVITAVNGVDVESLTPDEVQNLTIGEPGTTVTMTVRRYGIDEPLTFELERERIDVKNIAYAGFVGEQDDIGYILLSRFSQNTAAEIRNTIADFRSQKNLAGLILDLRNNPGGLLDEAVSTVDKFIAPGKTVVETRGRLNRHNNRFKTEETPVAPQLPLVVLQNGGSASASEIVAGAMQDLDRAVIMGEQSFGKGLVQVVQPLSYNMALKLTTSRYYIPSGRSIQSVRYTHDAENSAVKMPDSVKKVFRTENGRKVFDRNGIMPDVKIIESDPTLLQTSLLQKNMFFTFANQYAATHDSLEVSADSGILLQQFKDFLTKENFQYETPSETHLTKIDSLLGSDAANVEHHITSLGNRIREMKKLVFVEQRNEIGRMLFLELVSRYKGRQGQTAASLPHDPLVEAAVKVLKDSNRYNEILSVSN